MSVLSSLQFGRSSIFTKIPSYVSCVAFILCLTLSSAISASFATDASSALITQATIRDAASNQTHLSRTCVVTLVMTPSDSLALLTARHCVGLATNVSVSMPGFSFVASWTDAASSSADIVLLTAPDLSTIPAQPLQWLALDFPELGRMQTVFLWKPDAQVFKTSVVRELDVSSLLVRVIVQEPWNASQPWCAGFSGTPALLAGSSRVVGVVSEIVCEQMTSNTCCGRVLHLASGVFGSRRGRPRKLMTMTNTTSCGNGIVDTGEECDGGECCRTNCTLYTLADQKPCNLNEKFASQCTDYNLCNGTSASCPNVPVQFRNVPDGSICGNTLRPMHCYQGKCVDNATGSICGDGVVTQGEQCDPPSDVRLFTNDSNSCCDNACLFLAETVICHFPGPDPCDYYITCYGNSSSCPPYQRPNTPQCQNQTDWSPATTIGPKPFLVLVACLFSFRL